jgi:molybdopterin molybdotransferase
MPLTCDEAWDRIARAPAWAGGDELMPVRAAAGRILTQDVRLDRDTPPFDRAAMDGYAVMPAPGQRRYAVRGTVLAGQTWDAALLPGEAVRIMTGAPAPAGTAVVPHERTDRGLAQVVVQDDVPLDPGRHIARRGEDGRSGARVLAAGSRLGPATQALAAMAGLDAVRVQRQPRLHVIATGDELGGGEAGIHDSNGPLLAGFCHVLGLHATQVRCADDTEELADSLATQADVLVTTGGVAGGDRDLVPRIAAAAGFTPLLHGIDMQPGKPVLVARHADGRWLCGLPGNPVSVLATAHLVLLPVLARCGVRSPVAWATEILACDHVHRGQRRLFLPARRDAGGITPLSWHGSGDLIAAAAGDGLVDLAVGARLRAGDAVRFLPYLGAGDRGLLPDRS